VRTSRGRSRLAPADSEPCELLEWDTEFWGKRIGRVREGELDDVRAAEVDVWADAQRVDCLYYLAPGADPDSALAAERAGFGLMDVRTELACEPRAADLPGGIREAREDDAAPLRAIAAASHGVTRFYADPNFPNERCDDLYDTWISRSLEGWADAVLVADANGRPAGYVSCHLAERTGSIGLIAVDESARGAGLGVGLARAAVAWCAGRGADRMTVVTQGRNVAAVRTFERAGFLASSIDLWFHKWYAR
jgi:ribosomal protein S18 acetylase RimI-like enzyme